MVNAVDVTAPHQIQSIGESGLGAVRLPGWVGPQMRCTAYRAMATPLTEAAPPQSRRQCEPDNNDRRRPRLQLRTGERHQAGNREARHDSPGQRPLQSDERRNDREQIERWEHCVVEERTTRTHLDEPTSVTEIPQHGDRRDDNEADHPDPQMTLLSRLDMR